MNILRLLLFLELFMSDAKIEPTNLGVALNQPKEESDTDKDLWFKIDEADGHAFKECLQNCVCQ